MPDQVIHPFEPRPLHLVIQQVQRTSGTVYRLVAYGDGGRYCTPEFQTLAAVLALLHRADPGLDISSTVADDATTSIIFAADVVWTEAQRIRLGLLPQSR